MAKRWFDPILRLFDIYQIVAIPTVWALIATAISAGLGWADKLPLMFIFLGALFAFTTTIVAMLRYDEMKARLNPRDKLRISPSHWFTKEGPEESQFLTEIQIGCEIQNTATFPITYRITNLRTIFDGMTKVSDNFPLADVELLSLETGYPRDETLNPVGKPMRAIYSGTLELSLEFWRTGRKRKYYVDRKYALEFRYDLPTEEMIFHTK